MLALEYDEAVARQAWIDHGVEIGTDRGIEIGTEREKLSTVKNLLTTDLPLKEIARVVGRTEDDVRKVAEDLGVGEHVGKFV